VLLYCQQEKKARLSVQLIAGRTKTPAADMTLRLAYYIVSIL